MRTRSRVGAAWYGLIVLAGIGCASCGGGGDRLSAAAYAREASGICANANRAVRRIEIPPLDETRSASRAMGRVVVIQRDSIDGLRGLKPPQALGSLSQRWIALLDQGTDELDLMRSTMVRGRHALAVAYAGKAATLLDRAQVLVDTHGVTSCRGPSLALD